MLNIMDFTARMGRMGGMGETAEAHTLGDIAQTWKEALRINSSWARSSLGMFVDTKMGRKPLRRRAAV